MIKPKILFLDDEERILNALRAIFRFKYEVFITTSGDEALEILRTHQIAVVVSDQRMPKMTGIEFLRVAKEVAPDTIRILLTGFSDLRAIIDSVNEGEVFRFLNKPWGNQEIQAVVDEAVNVSLASTASIGATGELAPADEHRPVILVKCRDKHLFEQLRIEAADSFEMFHAPTQESALARLQNTAVSVLLSRLDEDDLTKGEDSIAFLKLLKQELPALLTVGMAQQTDHEKVVELINQAKVHRYVVLPSKPSRILFFIRSAVEQYRRNLENPALLRRQSVEVAPVEKAGLSEAVMSGIRSLRRLFSKGN